jgi:hypothetical protein
MSLSIVSLFLVGFNVSLVFEAALKKENEREHYSWFCYVSVTSGKKDLKSPGFPDYGSSERRYLTNQEMMEIRNVIDEMLEMEEEEDEIDSPEIEPENISGSEGDDNVPVDTVNSS